MNYENMTRRRVLCFQNQQTKARFFQTMDRTGCKISCSPYHDQIFLFHLRCLPSFVSAAAVFFPGLLRYSRVRITLFPLIKIQERTRFVNVSP